VLVANSELDALKSTDVPAAPAGERSAVPAGTRSGARSYARPAGDIRTLDLVGPGSRARVAWIDPGQRRQLEQHGIVEGALVRVESRAPFGGPLVLGIGRARLAIGRGVAREIRVEAAE
jgi:ferrous iron transport protein A